MTVRLETTKPALAKWEMPSMVDDAKREYRVEEHQEGYLVRSRIVGSHRWTDGPIFLSEEKAEEAMHRLAALNEDVGDDAYRF
jgi:hypothetical protein